jgi:CBS domain-containing protein
LAPERIASKAIEHRSFVMKIKDIMTPNVECVRPDDTLQEAARKMKEMQIGPSPVWIAAELVRAALVAACRR